MRRFCSNKLDPNLNQHFKGFVFVRNESSKILFVIIRFGSVQFIDPTFRLKITVDLSAKLYIWFELKSLFGSNLIPKIFKVVIIAENFIHL